MRRRAFTPFRDASRRCTYTKKNALRSSSGPVAAFTLIELLVVIAIVSILAAMLLPALKAAREQARIATCTNKIKQLNLACQMYFPAFGDRFPSNANSWSNWHVGYLYSLIANYYSEGITEQTFEGWMPNAPLRCPTVTPDVDNYYMRNGRYSMTGNYRLSGLLVRSGVANAAYLHGRPVNKVRHPSALVTWYETPYVSYGDSVELYYGELPPGVASYWSAFSYGGYPRWFHRSAKGGAGGNVMGFLDGHAKMLLYQQHNDAVRGREVNWIWSY